MSFTHTLTLMWENDGKSRNVLKEVEGTGGAQTSVDESVPDGQSDYEIAFTLDVSEIKAIYINSTQDVTLETNDGGSPVDTLALKANEPYVWWATSLFTNKLATDVTAIFITNASGSAATLRIEVVYDPTP